MSVFRNIGWRLRRLFSTTRSPLRPAESPLTNFQNVRDTVCLSIRQTEALTEANGRSPEQTVAVYLKNALHRANHKYEITFDHEPVSVESQQATCGEGSAFKEWSEIVSNEAVDHLRKDSNVLITNARGGGCGYIGGNVCTTPGAEIRRYRSYQKTGVGQPYRNIQANLHEVGHNLGAAHDMDDDTFGKQHPGMGWNEDGRWHRTPTCAGNGAPNYCGEMVEEREQSLDDAVRHLYYHDCFVENVLSVE